MDMQIGHKYQIYFTPNNINNKTVHILAIVDDDMIVFKYWLEGKQRWVYLVEWIGLFDLYEKNGNIKEIN
jgi:hypothetical protein